MRDSKSMADATMFYFYGWLFKERVRTLAAASGDELRP